MSKKKVTHINLVGVSSVAAPSKKRKMSAKKSPRRKPAAGAGRKVSGGARGGR